jgi:hypothetical protein
MAASLPTESTTLPVVHLWTYGQEITKAGITAKMGIADTGKNGFTDSCTAFSSPVDLDLHGYTSLGFPKLSYGIGLEDSSGDEVKSALLGMSKESGWILVASYPDKSCLRNAFGYAMSRASGRYAPRTRYVELVIDSSYEGLYLLTEKIQRNSERVDISKLDSTDTTGSALTGGYIVRLDHDDSGDSGWWSGNGYGFYQFYYPKYSRLLSQQVGYIEGYISRFESMMASDTFASTRGYPSWIDEGSFLDYTLLEELLKNIDAFIYSTYLYKDRDDVDGLLNAGPAWDLDLSCGLPNYNDGWSPEGWQYTNSAVKWWATLANSSAFRSDMAARWFALRQGVWSDSAWTALFDSLDAVVSTAQARNFSRWPILDEYVWPEAYVAGSWQGEVDTMRSWLEARIDWLDEKFTPLYRAHVSVEKADDAKLEFRQEDDRLVWTSAPYEAWIADLQGKRTRLPVSATVRLDRGHGVRIVSWKESANGATRRRLIWQ